MNQWDFGQKVTILFLTGAWLSSCEATNFLLHVSTNIENMSFFLWWLLREPVLCPALQGFFFSHDFFFIFLVLLLHLSSIVFTASVGCSNTEVCYSLSCFGIVDHKLYLGCRLFYFCRDPSWKEGSRLVIKCGEYLLLKQNSIWLMVSLWPMEFFQKANFTSLTLLFSGKRRQ